MINQQVKDNITSNAGLKIPKKTRYKVTLVFLIALVSLAVALNLPIINTGIIASGCSSFTRCTPPHPVYESLLSKYFPCMFSVCSSTPLMVTLFLFQLSAGTSTNQDSRGTASFAVAFNNPGKTTQISSYSFSSTGNYSASITLYQCVTSLSCTSVSRANISADRVTSFANETTMFYPSSTIFRNQTYNYIFNFANGQSISGTVTAN